MRADGSGQKRLTNVPGYDGGPFFTHDGSRIVWRRFDEMGLIADVWTMKLDGTDAKQITDFGSMSWAPYEHPSGKYFIFASNKLGFENFELFMVDAAGTKEPVRVTYSDGFDGLPVPSPDGTQLAWTSSRGGGTDGQLFLAQWNHQKALEAIRERAAEKAEQEMTRPQAQRRSSTPSPGLRGARRAAVDWRAGAHGQAPASKTRAHVTALASERLEGRLVGLERRTAGQRLPRRRSCGASARSRCLARAISCCRSSSRPARATADRRPRSPTRDRTPTARSTRARTCRPCRSRTTATSAARSSSPATASSCPRRRTSATTATRRST